MAWAWPRSLLACSSGNTVLLRRVPTLDLVEATPISLVGVVGLAIAELVELARELLAVLGGHRELEWRGRFIFGEFARFWPGGSMNGRGIGILEYHQLAVVHHNLEARLD